MNCDWEMLQEFLDGELDTEAARQLQARLRGCRECRREFSRLRRLWLELAQPEVVEAPPELPYLRQQAIAAASRAATDPAARIGFWESQRLAWASLGLAVAYLPGVEPAKTLTQNAAGKLPGLLAGALVNSGRRWLRWQFQKRGRH